MPTIKELQAMQDAADKLISPGANMGGFYGTGMGNLDLNKGGVSIGGGIGSTFPQAQQSILKRLNELGLDYNDPQLKNKLLLKAQDMQSWSPSGAADLARMANHIALDLTPRSPDDVDGELQRKTLIDLLQKRGLIDLLGKSGR